MVRYGLAGPALAAALLTSAQALAQSGPTLPTMPRPPSFSEPGAAEPKARKPSARKPAGQTRGAASSASGSEPTSFERPNRFVPSEFDREGRRDTGAGARPMMTPSGRAGMGMQF